MSIKEISENQADRLEELTESFRKLERRVNDVRSGVAAVSSRLGDVDREDLTKSNRRVVNSVSRMVADLGDEVRILLDAMEEVDSCVYEISEAVEDLERNVEDDSVDDLEDDPEDDPEEDMGSADEDPEINYVILQNVDDTLATYCTFPSERKANQYRRDEELEMDTYIDTVVVH